MRRQWLRAGAMAVCLAFSVPAAAYAQEEGQASWEEQEAGLRAAMDRTAGLTSFDWSGDVSARYSIRGLTMTVGQQTRFQASQAGTADMTALRRDVVSALGAEEETVSFYTGGCYYGEDYGFPMKNQMDPDAALSAMNGFFLTRMGGGLCDVLAADFSASAVTEEGEYAVYTYVADAGLLAELSAEEEEQYSVFALQFYVSPDGYVSREKMEVRFSGTEGDQPYELITYIDNRINSSGEEVSISLPSTDGYREWN